MGLLKTAARTAVITSTATRVHARNQARQQQQWAAQPPPPPPPPSAQPAPPPAAVHQPPPAPAAPAAPAPDMSAVIQQLTELGKLRDAGILTEAEFEAQKARILPST